MKNLIDYQHSRKKELTLELIDLLSAFKEETGLCVTSINLEVQASLTVDGEQDLYITNVDVRVEL